MTDLADAPDATLVDARYRLVDHIGAGESASVWSADDLRLGRTVAVKMFASAVPSDRAAAAFAVTESMWAPGMARVLDAGNESGGDGSVRTFVVRELVSGTSWNDWVAAGGVRVATLAAVGADVAATLAHLHRHGAAHGSISGSNIFVPDGPIGLRSSFDTDRITVLTDAGVRQMLGAPPSHPADDVRSLGETLLAALTGRDVVGSRTAHAALAHLCRDAGLRSRECGAWSAVLASMTGCDGAGRPSAAAASAALAALSLETAGQRSTKGPRRQRDDDQEPPWEIIFTV